MSPSQSVYALHLAGYSAAEISRELMIPKSRVEFLIVYQQMVLNGLVL